MSFPSFRPCSERDLGDGGIHWNEKIEGNWADESKIILLAINTLQTFFKIPQK